MLNIHILLHIDSEYWNIDAHFLQNKTLAVILLFVLCFANREQSHAPLSVIMVSFYKNVKLNVVSAVTCDHKHRLSF